MSTPEDLPEMTARAKISQELFENAALVKGADFANYAAVCLELAQVGGMIRKLANGKETPEKMKLLEGMAIGLLVSIDTKVYPDMTLDDRAEAGRLAGRILQGVDAAGNAIEKRLEELDD